MRRLIFVNLPVADLARTRTFYAALGFSLNAAHSDDACACVVVSETIVVMALQRERFADLVAGPVGDPAEGPTVIHCLSAESPAEVDHLVSTALAHGGKPWLDRREQGPVYGHSFADPDGHVWEVLHVRQAG